ncbi:MAG TPA: hypothetical protein VMT52_12265, partial [Planctomycetota bacterium]|nr:hypothetical protein [Planctomycetota bacterium]
LEIYADPGEVLVEPPPPALEVLATGGPVSTPAGPEDVPSFEDGNLARGPGAVPFGTPPHPAPAHEIAHLNDGIYGNSKSWLGNEPGPSSGRVYAGIYFTDGLHEIAQAALGRDNTGEFADRAAGAHVLQYTADPFDPADDAAVEAAAWTTIGQAAAHCSESVNLRRAYSFEPVMARAIRIITQLGNVFDEIEVGLQLGTLPPPELELVGTGGPSSTPAGPGDVPALEDGNLARSSGAVPFGTPPHPAPAHEIAHLNDGQYGNSQSWLGNEPGAVSGKTYAGIYFASGPVEIFEIALGRDNTGELTDRSSSSYLIQHTLDEFDPSDDGSVDDASWTTAGQAMAHLGDGFPGLRHVYCLGGIRARAVRVLAALGSVIDEIELLAPPAPPGLELAEIGGSLTPENLATAPGAEAFAIDELDFGVHFIPNLNDAQYGNSRSWIGASGSPGFAGIRFGGTKTVASVAFGRDNQEVPEFNDRYLGHYELQYTTAESPDASTSPCQWTTIGVVQYDEFCPLGPWMRHRYNFPPVQATAIRLLVPGTGVAGGTAIDELEVYEAPGEVTAEPCSRPPVLELVETGGPVATPAQPGDVPGEEEGNVARLEGVIPFGSPPHPAPVHEIAHLNDGQYGNSQSWLGNEPGASSGKVYAGIYFPSGLVEIEGIALGRDNTGQFGDRAAGAYLVEVSQDAFDPADDSSVEAASWVLLGLASAHVSDGSPALRHRYRFDPVQVRAVRVVTVLGNAIDEIELEGRPLAAEPGFRRGDSNRDGAVDISDPIRVLGFLFLGGAGLPCPDAADSNDDGNIDLSDAVYTLHGLFLGGDPIPAPGPEACGLDPTEDSLSECEYPEEIC